MLRALIGHDSPDTAHLITDYPYGVRLRCQRKVWIETRPGMGQRFVAQTQDPRTGVWNKPHRGSYHVLIVLHKDTETGHVNYDALSFTADEKKINAFVEQFGPEAFTDRYRTTALNAIRAVAKRMEKFTNK